MSATPGELSPFPIDPSVMSKIRPLQASDCPAVALLHSRAMGHSLWAKLGVNFLRVLYEELLKDDDFLAFVYEEGPKISGFIAGSLNTHQTFSKTFRRSWWHLLPAFLRGILGHPGALWPLLATPFYFQRSDPLQHISAESLFCSFAPELRGKRISGHINKVLFDKVFQAGHDYLKITTEEDNPGSNRQLTSWGFTVQHHFHFYGKSMVTYVIHLLGHPRINQERTPKTNTPA